jgi:hypothetical protein
VRENGSVNAVEKGKPAANTTIAETYDAKTDCRCPQKHRHDRNGQMSSRHSKVHRMQINHLVDRRQNHCRQGRVVLSSSDRRAPHPFMQATYLGEQSLNLVASFATEQCDPVGRILL